MLHVYWGTEYTLLNRNEQESVYIAGNLFNFAAQVSWTEEEGQRDSICEVSF